MTTRIGKQQKFPLAQMVLASSLFVSQAVLAVGDPLIIDGLNSGSDPAGAVTIPPPVVTSTQMGSVIIKLGGSIDIAGDLITIDDNPGAGVGRTVVVDPNNPIAMKASAGSAIAIGGTSTNASITVGSGSTLTASSNTIEINASGSSTSVANAGTIKSTAGSAFSVVGAITPSNMNIVNASTGILDASTIAVDFGSSVGSSLTNSGIIRSSTGGLFKASGTSIGTLTNNTSGKMQVTTDGEDVIEIAGTTAGSIINSGTMSSTTGAVINTAGGVSIVNAATGTMTRSGIAGGTDAVINVNVGAPRNVSINNSGVVQILNSATGLDAISYNTGVGPITGDITNSGTVTTIDGRALFIDTPVTGNITNVYNVSADTNGTFKTTTTTTDANGNSIYDIDAIIKQQITNITPNSNLGIKGYLTNTSKTTAFSPVEIADKVTGTFTNAGVISTLSTNIPALILTGTGEVTGGIINKGIIASPNDTVVDLSGSTKLTKFTNDVDGIINGGVKLSSTAGDAFELKGGQIDGLVSSPAMGAELTVSGGILNGDATSKAITFNGGGGASNKLTITGGTINGDVTLAASVAGDNIFLKGGTVNGTIFGSVGKNDTLTVEATATTGGPIQDIANIKVTNANTIFNVNHDITNLGSLLAGASLTVDADTTLNATGKITNVAGGGFAFTNNGTTNIKAKSVINTGDIATSILTSTGTLGFEITSPLEFGHIITSSKAASNITGSTIAVTLTGTGFNPTNSKYTVIQSGAAGIGSIKITQPSSTTLSFNRDPNDLNNLVLIATRIPFANIAQTDNTKSVGTALDNVITQMPISGTSLESIVGALDALGTIAEVDSALRLLTPQVDDGLSNTSKQLLKNTFHEIGRHLHDAHELFTEFSVYQSGDLTEYSQGYWAKVYTTSLSQKSSLPFVGYNTIAQGIIMGYDRNINPNFIMGGAIAYAYADVDSKLSSTFSQEIDSAQIAVYTNYDTNDAWFFDTMAILARNTMTSTRTITFGAFTSATPTIGETGGWNIGFNVEGGHKLSYGPYRINPMMVMRYTRQSMDPYTEVGPGALLVAPENTHELVTGIGVKFYGYNEYAEATYVPEFRYFAYYDWVGDPQEATSNFLGSSVPFSTMGFVPAQLSHNFGFGLLAISRYNLHFKLDYELEIKDKFRGHMGSIKFRYEW